MGGMRVCFGCGVDRARARVHVVGQRRRLGTRGGAHAHNAHTRTGVVGLGQRRERGLLGVRRVGVDERVDLVCVVCVCVCVCVSCAVREGVGKISRG